MVASEIRIAQGHETRQGSDEEFHGQRLAVYLTPLKVIKPFPVHSVVFHEQFKKRLDAVAKEKDLETVDMS